tara:strand:- start:3292 stop:4197 length:906 start_codon:yes stop_codon:yes gene_type:complete
MSIKQLAEDNLKDITEQIIKDMEQHDPSKPFIPKWIENFHMNVEGKPYTGWNQFHLNFKYGYKTPIWGTFFQWQKIGLRPRSKTGIPLWQPMIKKETDPKTDKEKIIKRFKTVAIFSIDDVKGDTSIINDLKISLTKPTRKFDHDVLEEIEPEISRLTWLGLKITDGNNRACYIPQTDEIKMPHRTQFRKRESYYSTLFHEITHWTGHSSRCNRNLKGNFASNDYAFEELIAELGASFHMAHYNLLHETRSDHVHYLKSWAKALRDKPDSLRSACKYASQSFFFVRNKAEVIASDKAVGDV